VLDDHILYPTFNALTDNPDYGFEPNFLLVKESNSVDTADWHDEIKVEPGATYLLRVYVHNNANTEYAAENTNIRVFIPAYEALTVQVDAYLSSSNAVPNLIWDQIYFRSPQNRSFTLSFVEGTAKFYNNKHPDGIALSDEIVHDGEKLGYAELDGIIPGGFQYDGIVTLMVKASVRDVGISATVRVAGKGASFSEDVQINPGKKAQFQVYAINKGDIAIDQMIVSVRLPLGLEYIPGTSFVRFEKTNENKAIRDGITEGGTEIQDVKPHEGVYFWFKAKVVEDYYSPSNTQTYIVSAKVVSDNGIDEDETRVHPYENSFMKWVKRIRLAEEILLCLMMIINSWLPKTQVDFLKTDSKKNSVFIWIGRMTVVIFLLTLVLGKFVEEFPFN
jgi:hypothetical protein